MKKELKVFWLKAKLLFLNVCIGIGLSLCCGGSVYAKGTGIGQSIYVTGTKKLLKDALTALQVIVGLAALVLWVFWEIQKKMGDENEESRLGKRQKTTIISVIIAETIMTLFNVIGSYYGISFS